MAPGEDGGVVGLGGAGGGGRRDHGSPRAGGPGSSGSRGAGTPLAGEGHISSRQDTSSCAAWYPGSPIVLDVQKGNVPDPPVQLGRTCLPMVTVVVPYQDPLTSDPLNLVSCMLRATYFSKHHHDI